MIWGPISDDARDKAAARAEGATDLWRSIRGEQHGDGSSFAGALGEVCVESVLRRSGIEFEYVGVEAPHADLKVGWATIDVKAKCRTSDDPPSMKWEATVEHWQLERHRPTYYWFVSLHHGGGRDGSSDPAAFHHAAILGACPRWQFHKQGRLLRKGVADRGGYVPHVDQVNLDYDELVYADVQVWLDRLRHVAAWDHLSPAERSAQEARRARR